MNCTLISYNDADVQAKDLLSAFATYE